MANAVKTFNRDVNLGGNSRLMKGTTELIDKDGNVKANIQDSLASGKIYVGDASGVAAEVAVSGDATLANNGALTIATGAVEDSMIEGLAAGQIIIGVDGTAANNLKTVLSGDVTMDGTGAVTIGSQKVTPSKMYSGVAGVVVGFIPTAVQQDLSGAGAVTLTEYYTAVTNTGSDALTLADSTVTGQLKKVKMIVDPGTDSTLTFNTNATIVFADVGDYAVLMWNGSDWLPIELGNDADGATAPAYTPAA